MATIEHSYDALRWLLNHAEESPRKQVGGLMQCFQMHDGQRWPVKMLLESLWEKRKTAPAWRSTTLLFDADGKIIANGIRGLILWDDKNKRTRHGTQLDVFGNPARYTHYIDPIELGEPDHEQ